MKKVLVEGMMCQHCKAHVEKALNEIDGVHATVDLENNCAFVEGEVDEASLKQAIEEAGPTHVTIGEFFIVSTGERTRLRFYRTGRENNTLALFYRELEIPRHI